MQITLIFTKYVILDSECNKEAISFSKICVFFFSKNTLVFSKNALIFLYRTIKITDILFCLIACLYLKTSSKKILKITTIEDMIFIIFVNICHIFVDFYKDFYEGKTHQYYIPIIYIIYNLYICSETLND